MNKQALWEAIKEVARLALFAAASAVVAWATTELTTLEPGSPVVIVGTVLLRFADRFIHESPNINAKGIAPF